MDEKEKIWGLSRAELVVIGLTVAASAFALYMIFFHKKS